MKKSEVSPYKVRNSIIFLLKAPFVFPAFWVPIVTAYLMAQKGLTVTAATSVIGFYSIMVVLLEVPTGFVADKYSKKLSVVSGYTLTSLAFFVLAMIDGTFAVYILLFALAVGTALISGADGSLVYENLEKNGLKSGYRQVVTFGGLVTAMLALVYASVAGTLYKLDPDLPILLSAFFYLSAGVISLFYEEQRREKNIDSQAVEVEATVTARELLKKIVGNRSLLYLIIVISLFDAVIISMKWIIPPVMDSYSYSLNSISIVTSAIIGAAAVGKLLGMSPKRLLKKLPLNFLLMFTSLLWLLLAIYQLEKADFLIIVMLANAVMYVYFSIVLSQILNDQIGSRYRATINSASSFVSRFLVFVFTTLVGVAISASSENYFLILMGIIITISSGLVLVRFRKELSDLLR